MNSVDWEFFKGVFTINSSHFELTFESVDISLKSLL